MKCKKCGTELTTEQFCPNCGEPANFAPALPDEPADVAQQGAADFFCPYCGNNDLQAVVENNTITSGKDFSAGKGCLGALIFGPLGLLCGLCTKGKKTITTNKTYWACAKCGKKFRDLSELKKELASAKKIKKVMGILAPVLSVMMLAIGILMLSAADAPEVFVFSVIYAVIMALAYLGTFLAAKEKQKELDEIENGMQRFRHKNL